MALVPQRLYGLIGHPIGHSLSPVLHNWGFSRVGHPGVYMAWDRTPEQLPGFISAARGLPVHGASVTIPDKEPILKLVDKLTPVAEKAGAVNTLYWEEDLLVGTNTDVDGFIYPLGGYLPKRTLILGAGGAARAVLTGLWKMGVTDVHITTRSQARLEPLLEEFQCTGVPWEDRVDFMRGMAGGLVVNTTPMGMSGENQGRSALPEEAWPEATEGSVAYDIVYNPRETAFLRQARARGWETREGLRFFVAQAVAQFYLWTGHSLPYDEAFRVVEDALDG